MKKIKITENDIRFMVKNAIMQLINEDVFANKSLLNKKNKTVGLTYNKHVGRNADNLSSFDMLNTDKMESNNEDTYEVTLKGGITSYNITSIKGEAVMHYFKNKFLNGGNDAKIKAGNEEYKLIMEEPEFKKFLNVFNSKVNRVINYCINNFKKENPEIDFSKVSIYPVPSRSNFNNTMANIMSHMTLGNLPVRVVNTDILKKDYRNLERDEDFIEKNKDFFNGKMFQTNSPEFNGSVSDYLNRDVNKFHAMNNAKRNIEVLNIAAEKTLRSLYNYMNKKTPGLLNSLVNNYKNYYDTLQKCTIDSGYENPISSNGSSKVQIAKIAKAQKYTKGPSVEKRTNFMWSLIKPYLRNEKSPLTNMPYSKVDIKRWEPQDFEIKNLSNSERMGLKNYFNQNQDLEFVKKEMDEIKGGVLVIFDDNISGGATLSDICYQLKNLGAEHLIPITFGKMSAKITMNRIPLSMPINNKGDEGFNY